MRPDGSLQCFQPYGKEGLLIADIDICAATGLLASCYNPWKPLPSQEDPRALQACDECGRNE